MAEIWVIEYCINCSTHAWCTRHKEEKYLGEFTSLKNRVMKKLPNVMVQGNVVPMGFKNEFFVDTEYSFIHKANKMQFPRVGAFEVYFDSQVIHSKLENGLWPNAQSIIAKIQQIIVDRNLRRGKSAAPKRFKIKMKKKRFRKIKSSEPCLARPKTSYFNTIKMRRRKWFRQGFKLVRPNFVQSQPTKQLAAQMTPITKNPNPQKRPNLQIGMGRKTRKGLLSDPKLKSSSSPADSSFERAYQSKPVTPAKQQRPTTVLIDIRSTAGIVTSLTVQTSHTVSQVKVLYEQRTGQYFKGQDLQWGQRILQDERTLMYYGITNDDELTIIEQPRTAAWQEKEDQEANDENQYAVQSVQDNYIEDEYYESETDGESNEFIQKAQTMTPQASDRKFELGEREIFTRKTPTFINQESEIPSDSDNFERYDNYGITSSEKETPKEKSERNTEIVRNKEVESKRLYKKHKVQEEVEKPYSIESLLQYISDEIDSEKEDPQEVVQVSDEIDSEREDRQEATQVSDEVDSEREDTQEAVQVSDEIDSEREDPQEAAQVSEAAQSEKTKTESEEEYEDDFEDYSDDFEEESEEDETNAQEDDIPQTPDVEQCEGELLSDSEASSEIQPTKSFAINLKVGRPSNKKINFSNPSKNPWIFELVSSEPDLMQLRESVVQADANESGKFKLKFAQVDQAWEKVFRLQVYRDDELYEIIEIITNYI